MMDRRKALKVFGALFVCLVGRDIAKAETTESVQSKYKDLVFSSNQGPTDYYFAEEGIGNIIIERKNGKRIIVPFSDIVDALDPEAQQAGK